MLDKEPEELQYLGVFGILRESFNVLRSCARQLGLITLTVILPLSFAILGHTLVSSPLLRKIQRNEDEFEREQPGGPAADRTLATLSNEWTRLLLFQAGYFVFLFAFSLLSTAAVVYAVACVYTGKDTTYGKIVSVVPRVWRRLMLTFLWYFLIMVAYNTVVIVALVIVILLVGPDNDVALAVCFAVLLAAFVAAHVYISALWHLGSVVSVLEEEYGSAAIRKSRELIRGKVLVALVLVFCYFAALAAVNGLFRLLVVHGGAGAAARVLWAAALVALLVGINLVGLLVQSVFYYVCKSYHHQSIDKSVLSDHLEEYLGDYVPLKSSIQMESLDLFDP